MKFRTWGGVPVDEVRRDEWANQVIDYLEKNPNEKSYYIMSGDSIVSGFRYPPSKTYPEGELEVFDSRLRRTWSSVTEGYYDEQDRLKLIQDNLGEP